MHSIAIPTHPMNGTSLPPPLRVVQDMAARWLNSSSDFDAAAHAIVEAHKNDGEARDLPVMDLATWGVLPKDGVFSLAPLHKRHGPLALRSAAFSGLMTKFNAPTEFIRDHLPAPLQLAVCNWLLAKNERQIPATLRMRGDHVAAIVSDRYAAFDNEQLLGCVRDALERHGALGDVEVRSIATGPVDVLRCVFPNQQTAVKVGDISALGLDISSSCFGRSAVHVRGIVWRLKCTNGLRVAEGTGNFSFRHVGDVDRLRSCIADAIPTALVHARGTMARWRASVDVMVQDVLDFIGELQLNQSERRLVEDKVKVEAGTSNLLEPMPLYTVLNGVTAAAHEVVPARRLELESAAGELLVRHTRGVS